MSKYLLAILMATIALLLPVTGCRGDSPEQGGQVDTGFLEAGDTAPDFKLPAASGGEVSLLALLEQRPALLYFNMAYG